ARRGSLPGFHRRALRLVRGSRIVRPPEHNSASCADDRIRSAASSIIAEVYPRSTSADMEADASAENWEATGRQVDGASLYNFISRLSTGPSFIFSSPAKAGSSGLE